jgi:hypothetical protein
MVQDRHEGVGAWQGHIIEPPLALKPFLRLPAAKLAPTLAIPSCQSESSFSRRLFSVLVYPDFNELARWTVGPGQFPLKLNSIDIFIETILTLMLLQKMANGSNNPIEKEFT